MYNTISPRGLQYLNDFTIDAVSVPTIIKLQALDMWTLEMEWTMNQKEERRNQTYEIQVGRTTNMDIVDSVRETHHSSHYDLIFVLCTNGLQSIHR